MSEFAIASAPASNDRVSSRRYTLTRARIVIGALIGNVAGTSTVLTYTMGIFISSFYKDFGWSRADTSLSMTWFTVVIFLGAPLIGRLADRISPGRVAAISMLAFGMVLLYVPHFLVSVGSLWFAYLALGVAGLGTLPVVVNRPVVAAFGKSRALAIAVALAGVGAGGFLAPRFVSVLIERGGWPLGFTGLGWACMAIAPIIWVTLGERPIRRGDRAADGARLQSGLSFREASRLPNFWLLCAIALCGGLGVSGPATHLIPYLRDHGMSLSDAGSLASFIGVSSIAGRLITGFVLDRTEGPSSGAPLLLVGAVGSTLLVLLGVKFAVAAAILLGFAIGSEIDLLAYFTSRYFGLRAHASVFGAAYAMVALGAAVGPVAMGALRDHQGDYALGFWCSSAALVAAGLLCALLGPYPYGTDLE